MKIMVTVKQVPDTSGKVAVNDDGTLNRASMQTIINPDDLNAVEEALSLKDEYGCKVVAFTMGPMQAEPMLRELLAMGVEVIFILFFNFITSKQIKSGFIVFFIIQIIV